MDPQAVHAGSPPAASGIPSDPARSARWHRWTAVALLIAINHFNYIDRQILAAVEPEIRKELFPEAGEAAASDAKFWMGLLPFAFLITYMFLAPLFGMLADRYSRWKIVGIGVMLWSIAKAAGASGWEWGLGLAAGILGPLRHAALLRRRRRGGARTGLAGAGDDRGPLPRRAAAA